jgi:citrate/tricarballylate utilization protein
VLRLKYLDGGHGDGCHNEDDAYTLARRAHHLTFYGFMLCFAATSVATLYHYALGWAGALRPAQPAQAAGRGGRRELLLGTAGLWRLNLRAPPAAWRRRAKADGPRLHRAAVPHRASGLALWLARGTPALALLLCLHLGAVMALFATLPYGKFAHGIFRTAALLRHAVEKRQPNPIGLGAD